MSEDSERYIKLITPFYKEPRYIKISTTRGTYCFSDSYEGKHFIYVLEQYKDLLRVHKSLDLSDGSQQDISAELRIRTKKAAKVLFPYFFRREPIKLEIKVLEKNS